MEEEHKELGVAVVLGEVETPPGAVINPVERVQLVKVTMAALVHRLIQTITVAVVAVALVLWGVLQHRLCRVMVGMVYRVAYRVRRCTTPVAAVAQDIE